MLASEASLIKPVITLRYNGSRFYRTNEVEVVILQDGWAADVSLGALRFDNVLFSGFFASDLDKYEGDLPVPDFDLWNLYKVCLDNPEKVCSFWEKRGNFWTLFDDQRGVVSPPKYSALGHTFEFWPHCTRKKLIDNRVPGTGLLYGVSGPFQSASVGSILLQLFCLMCHWKRIIPRVFDLDEPLGDLQVGDCFQSNGYPYMVIDKSAAHVYGQGVLGSEIESRNEIFTKTIRVSRITEDCFEFLEQYLRVWDTVKVEEEASFNNPLSWKSELQGRLNLFAQRILDDYGFYSQSPGTP